MPEIRTEAVVAAPAERLFDILVDAPRWSEWNRLLRVVRGELAADGSFVGRIALGPLPLFFDATVTRFERGRALAWKGPRLGLLQRLAVGEHYFELEPLADGGTRLVHGERFDGVVPNIERVWGRIAPNLTRAYSRFNQHLAKRAQAERVA